MCFFLFMNGKSMSWSPSSSYNFELFIQCTSYVHCMHVVNDFPIFYVYFRFLRSERTRNPQFCNILLREDESTSVNISAVFILTFLLREIIYSIASNQCTVIDMTVCIASLCVYRNNQEACEHTPVHDSTLTLYDLN